MDRNVNAAAEYHSSESQANEGACLEVAVIINGLEPGQADMCEEMRDGYGKFRCCGCPWQPTSPA